MKTKSFRRNFKKQATIAMRYMNMVLIKFTKARITNGESNPTGAELYNYQIVDVYGGGAGTKSQALGTEVVDGFSLNTGVTLYSTATKSAFTRTLVCADLVDTLDDNKTGYTIPGFILYLHLKK